MSRMTYVLTDDGLVEKSEYMSRDTSDPAFHFISDTMAATQHMADGKFYDSKSAFRKATRAAGCIEVGNEKLAPRLPPTLSREQRGRDIKNAIEQLRARR